MKTYSKQEVNQYIINSGFEYTTDIFILFGNVYIKIISYKQYALKSPNNIMTYKQSSSYLYLCWNYKTGVKRYVDFDTFSTQFRAFNLMKTTWDNFYDLMIEEILNNDLESFAFQSEHLL